MIIDSHCHLFDKAFNDDFDETLRRAVDANVLKFIMIGYSPSTNVEVLKIHQKYDFCYPVVGLHPNDLEELSDKDLEELENLIINNNVYGIGECGLDYYWHKDNKEKQKYFFTAQIKLAIKYNLPLVIHCRDAINDTYQILKEFKGQLNFVMHGYSGSLEMAKEFIKLGGKIGVGGVSTFKNAKDIKETIAGISLNDILLETDCPYLTPEPYRGKRNEPSYMPYISKKVAELKNITIEEVETITSNNTIFLFKI